MASFKQILNGATGAASVLTSAIQSGVKMSELPSTDEQQGEIDDLYSNYSKSSSMSDLQNLFDSTRLAKTDYGWRDLIGMSDGAVAGNIIGDTLTQGLQGGVAFGPIGAGIGAAVGAISSGFGYLARKNKAKSEAERLNKEGERANDIFLANFSNSVENAMMNKRNQSLLNLAAFGGPLDTTFTNGVRFITEGGSHSQNPLGGIPQGIASDGIPNLVEEGEVIYNDYVYSKRLKIPQADKESLGLKKDKEYTYADAAKQIQKESEERPNDPISRRNLEEMMGRLQGSQEALKEKRDGQALKRAVNKMTPDELAMFMQQMQQPQQMQPMAGMQSMQPMQPTQSEVPMFANGGLLGHKFVVGGNTDESKSTIPIGFGIGYSPYVPSYSNFVDESGKFDPLIYAKAFESNLEKYNPKPYDYPVKTSKVSSKDDKDTLFNPAQALRAAPIIGSIGTTIASLFDKPNYSNIARAERAAASVPRVSATPIGQRMSYTPIDINYIATQQANNALGARRALAEYGAGNPAGVQQAQIANNYANQTALGQAIMQAGQLNRQNLAQTLEFNRQTDSANAASNLQAALANQQRDANYANFLLQTGQLRDEEMRRIQAAISANITNLFNNIGNLGSDMLSRQMVKAGMDAGVFGNYGTNNTGPYGALINDLFTQMAQQYMEGKNKSNKKEE